MGAEITQQDLKEVGRWLLRLPVFDRNFFDMPRGSSDQWAFDSFKEKARAAGGVVSDEMLSDLKEQLTDAMRLGTADVVAMMDQDADYI